MPLECACIYTLVYDLPLLSTYPLAGSTGCPEIDARLFHHHHELKYVNPGHYCFCLCMYPPSVVCIVVCISAWHTSGSRVSPLISAMKFARFWNRVFSELADGNLLSSSLIIDQKLSIRDNPGLPPPISLESLRGTIPGPSWHDELKLRPAGRRSSACLAGV